jgi:Peptidase family M23
MHGHVPLHLQCHFTRRTVVRLMAAAGLLTRIDSLPARAQTVAPVYSYPMGFPGRPLGDGLLVRHGYATENTWYNPGWLHTGEDWYLPEGETGGLGVYAAAAGEVIFAGSEYPGLVVIVQHPDGLFSMYGHLDYTLAVEPGQAVARGQLLGTILTRTDGLAPSHLHFELRSFFTTPEVNGDAPRYGVACGFDCPPGPGYWPLDAPEHPSAMGWRNPTHVINRRAWPGGVPAGAEVLVAAAAPETTPLWSAPADVEGAESLGDLTLVPGEQYPLREIATGVEDATGASAEAYRVWYQVALPDGDIGWVQAAVPTDYDIGSDGRPSSVQFDFLPAITAD